MASQDDSALRAHVQDILLDYALAHLTTDYVAYTRNATNEVLSASLYPVPTTDPTSFSFEPSVAKAVCTIFKTSQPEQYEERWAVDKQVAKYLRESGIPGRGKQPSERFWYEDLDGGDATYRPMSPTLTIKAIQDTPAFGNRVAAAPSLDSPRSLTRKYGISSVDAARIDDPALDIDAALGNRLIFDDVVYRSANTLLKSVLSAAGSRSISTENDSIRGFLRAESPVHAQTQLIDVPLFPRNEQGIRSASDEILLDPSLMSMKSLPSILPKIPEHQGSEDDLYKQHMVVVNGWQAFEFPSSPLHESTPSLGVSSSPLHTHEFDELLLLSPPGTSYLQDLENARMEEIEIPRSAKIGESRFHEEPSIGEGQSLSTFLTTFQLSPAPDTAQIITSPKSLPSSPRTSITASMLGQFGDFSQLNGANANGNEVKHASWGEINLNGGDDDFGKMLERLFDEDLPRDPTYLILDEKLDERESFLMHVPDLPPPTYGSNIRGDMPTSFLDLLSDSVNIPGGKPSSGSALQPYNSFFERTKGLKSLNLELSWRPFDFGTSVPTHEEVSHVETDVQATCVVLLEETRGDDDPADAVSALLNPFTVSGDISDPSETAWVSDIEDLAGYSIESPDEFILTAAEQRRIYGLPDPSYDDEEESEDEQVGPSPKRVRLRQASFTTPSKKTVSFDEAIRTMHFEDFDDGDGEPFDLTEYADPFHDSGVYIPQSQPASLERPTKPRPSVFGGLASSAEGFQGSDRDDDIIPDVDPVHFDDLATLGYPPWDGNAFDAHIGGNLVPMAQLLDRSHEPRAQQAPVLAPSSRRSPEYPPATDEEALDTTTGSTTAPIPCLTHQQPNTDTISASLPITKISSASRSLQQFMKLRSKKTIVPEEECADNAVQATLTTAVPSVEASQHFQVPAELVGKFTLTLPEDYSAEACFPHRYLASLDLIQKRGLVRALSRQHAGLVEREFLDGVDMILDQDTAVFIVSLRTLPAQCDAVSSGINKASWRFLNVLVVFETFSPSAYFKDDCADGGPMANPFSPPVIKAVKKLTRNLSIAEACEDKRTDTAVHLAYPLTVDDVARTLRMYGDIAHDRDVTGGLLWDDRRWLDLDEEDTDEQDLAAIDGMNVFAAAIILANTNLDEFLDRTPQERMDEFGSVIGADRVNMFNRVIARRIEAMQLPPSSPPATSLGTSNSVTPLEGVLADAAEMDWPLYE